ncbi:MAG: RNA polymerase sigma factor [Candidatus Cryptobacteroides sp.]
MRFDMTDCRGLGDMELIVLLGRGDKSAFTEIYNRYISQLYTLAYRYIKDEDVTKDILQQVFEKLWTIRKGISPSVQIRSYLYAMTRNAVMNYIRNNRTALQHNYVIAQSRGDFEDDIYEKADAQGRVDELMNAIGKLPEQQRKVALYRCEGLSNSEIARIMSLSLNTVNSHYMQCLKNLKRILNTFVDSLIIFVLLNL